MMTVHEVSRLTGVSIRTLHYYDSIGLLPATEVTEAGYRLYDTKALERLQSILLFRELEFPLRDIKQILDSPGFDRNKALEQQITLLEMRREHLIRLIDLARGMQMNGEKSMSFEAFDTSRLDEYARQAKEAWGATDEYREFETKDRQRTASDNKALAEQMMDIFAGFGAIKRLSPDSPEAISQAQRLQQFITDNYYTCPDEVFSSLADMYAAGGEFTENIDKSGGEGTAVFACNAIHAMINAKSRK